MWSHLPHILDFFSVRLPPAGIETSNDDPLAIPSGGHPIPWALIATGPRTRRAAEFHAPADGRDGGAQQLCVSRAYSASDLARRLTTAGSHLDANFPGTLSDEAVQADYRAFVRRPAQVYRTVSFPSGTVAQALDLASWWLARGGDGGPTGAEGSAANNENNDQQQPEPLAVILSTMVTVDSVSLADTARFPALASVELRGRRLSLDVIDGCRGLRELHVVQCVDMIAGFDAIPGRVDPALLSALSLESCRVTGLEWLPELAHLTWLRISGCRNLTDLTPVAELRQLTWLDLAGTDGAELYWLGGCTALEYLCVDQCRAFTDDVSLRPLCRLQRLSASETAVTSLEFLTGPVGEAGGGAAATVADSLHRLSLRESELETLQGVGRLTVLEVLDVYGTRVPDTPFMIGDDDRLLDAANVLPGLTHLCISGTDLDEDGLEWVVRAFPNLICLDLAQCSYLDGSLDALGRLAPTLRVLDLRRYTGVMAIPAAVVTALRELCMSNCEGIEELYTEVLARARRLRVLHAQYLDSCASLEWMRGCPEIEEVDLEACESLDSVSGLRHTAGTIRRLIIGDTAVSSLVGEVDKCEKLTYFTCNGCPLDKPSEKLVARLFPRGAHQPSGAPHW